MPKDKKSKTAVKLVAEVAQLVGDATMSTQDKLAKIKDCVNHKYFPLKDFQSDPDKRMDLDLLCEAITQVKINPDDIAIVHYFLDELKFDPNNHIDHRTPISVALHRNIAPCIEILLKHPEVDPLLTIVQLGPVSPLNTITLMPQSEQSKFLVILFKAGVGLDLTLLEIAEFSKKEIKKIFFSNLTTFPNFYLPIKYTDDAGTITTKAVFNERTLEIALNDNHYDFWMPEVLWRVCCHERIKHLPHVVRIKQKLKEKCNFQEPLVPYPTMIDVEQRQLLLPRPAKEPDIDLDASFKYLKLWQDNFWNFRTHLNADVTFEIPFPKTQSSSPKHQVDERYIQTYSLLYVAEVCRFFNAYYSRSTAKPLSDNLKENLHIFIEVFFRSLSYTFSMIESCYNPELHPLSWFDIAQTYLLKMRNLRSNKSTPVDTDILLKEFCSNLLGRLYHSIASHYLNRHHYHLVWPWLDNAYHLLSKQFKNPIPEENRSCILSMIYSTGILTFFESDQIERALKYVDKTLAILNQLVYPAPDLIEMLLQFVTSGKLDTYNIEYHLCNISRKILNFDARLKNSELYKEYNTPQNKNLQDLCADQDDLIRVCQEFIDPFETGYAAVLLSNLRNDSKLNMISPQFKINIFKPSPELPFFWLKLDVIDPTKIKLSSQESASFKTKINFDLTETSLVIPHVTEIAPKYIKNLIAQVLRSISSQTTPPEPQVDPLIDQLAQLSLDQTHPISPLPLQALTPAQNTTSVIPLPAPKVKPKTKGIADPTKAEPPVEPKSKTKLKAPEGYGSLIELTSAMMPSKTYFIAFKQDTPELKAFGDTMIASQTNPHTKTESEDTPTAKIIGPRSKGIQGVKLHSALGAGNKSVPWVRIKAFGDQGDIRPQSSPGNHITGRHNEHDYTIFLIDKYVDKKKEKRTLSKK